MTIEEIKAELERRLKINLIGAHTPFRNGKCEAFREIISLIDSMQKEPKFKVGDKICFKLYHRNTNKIIAIDNKGYFCEDGMFLHFEDQDGWELIEDPTVWHDASEEPESNKEFICIGEFNNPLVLSSNSDSFKKRTIIKWAYFDELLKL